MPNALYTRLIDILVNSGSVPEEQAKLNLGRLLKLNNSNEDSLTVAQCAAIIKNLEGIVILRGDKTRIGEARPLLNAITKQPY